VAAGTQPSSNPQEWKEKYFASLSSLESEQRQFRAIEEVLKRLIGRLCITSRGQSPKLDDEIKTLQAALRRETKNDELDKIASALSAAINALDEPAVGRAVAAQPPTKQVETMRGEERIRSVLAALLAELRRDPELILQVDALDAELAAAMTGERLPEVLSSVAELVGRRINRIERAKQEMEVLLSHMVGKLDEIGRFVAVQNQDQSQSLASSESLNTQLVGEMQAMGASVASAVDLNHIRTQVRSRIDSIGRHLQEFRQRETARAADMHARTEQMQARVSALEAEANRLQTQLQDEQRQSTLDVLTKIPNRLAYEKRMDEELKRFQRFKQPTCIAVWDVDRFKTINDTFGHAAGDRVLIAVAQCLAARIRATDFIARYGGEEFVMILCGAKPDDAMRLVDTMRVDISNLKLHFRGTPLAVTISSGVTALLAQDSAAAAFERADKALYRAKASGRNCCVGD